MENLNELIPQYASNKAELDSYKKICDKENAQIKEIMLSEKLDICEAGGYKATCTVSVRESMNEEKLLEIYHKNEALIWKLQDLGVIKTKEYVDFDMLEKAIYDEIIPKEMLLEMDKAKESKEVVTLRVSKIKKKEDK